LAVAKTFVFSCFGFLASLFPRLLPLAMICPFNVQRSEIEMKRHGCSSHCLPFKGTQWVISRNYVGWGSCSVASSKARC
jgi:hypothetical protein